MNNRELYLSEIFTAIQGESTYAGEEHIFIRTAGCRNRCSYCDTPKSLGRMNSFSVNAAGVIETILDTGINNVTITGGEPLMQGGVYYLLDKLVRLNLRVFIFTSGGDDFDKIPSPVIKILDIKTPGSGMANNTQIKFLKSLTSRDEIKFVITNRADFDWACDYITTNDIRNIKTVLFSPAWGYLSGKTLSEWFYEFKNNSKTLPGEIHLNPLLHHEDRFFIETPIMVHTPFSPPYGKNQKIGVC